MPLALYTFGQFIQPADDKANDGFYELNDPIFRLVDQTDGMIARSGYSGDPGPRPWGDEVYPRFYDERGDGWSPATLSLWQDMEALFVFTYSGLHAEALKRGREWFRKGQWPPLAIWWHDGSLLPTWSQGVERHEYLHDHGPSPFAFTFKTPFDRKGDPSTLDMERVRAACGLAEAPRDARRLIGTQSSRRPHNPAERLALPTAPSTEHRASVARHPARELPGGAGPRRISHRRTPAQCFPYG